MSINYNTQLQSNNTDLQAILDTINELPDAGGSDPVLQDKIVTPTTNAQTITADSGYNGLDTVIVNAMPTATQATPSISINANGLITASATQSAGYVAAGTKTNTKQLTTQAAQTITPGTYNKTIASGRYLTGTQTIKGDSNLVAGNIKNGVSIFGVTGTHSGGSGGGGGNASSATVSIEVRNLSPDTVYYWDSSKQIQTVDANTTKTVDILNGVLWISATEAPPHIKDGEYVVVWIGGSYYLYMFLSDGTLICPPMDP